MQSRRVGFENLRWFIYFVKKELIELAPKLILFFIFLVSMHALSVM